MRKILFLGGVVQTIPFVKKAKQMGVFTCVTDNINDSPAKFIADETVNIDCYDIDSLETYVNQNKIDGILVACADRLLEPYYELCVRTKKPCYLNRKVLDSFNNKRGLKDILRKYELPYIPEYKLNENSSDIKKIEFPCFIKPVDSNSSKGMSICYSKDLLDKCVEKALSVSRSKEILIEKVMNTDNIMIEYFFERGVPHLRSVCDRYVTHENKNTGTIPLALIYPSKHTDLFNKTIRNKLERIFKDLDIRDGLLSFEAFVENDNIMLYDPALRSTGAEEYVLYKECSNIDLLEKIIDFSLTGSISLKENECAKTIKNCCANLVIQIKTGKIGRIKGVEEINKMESVINITQCHKVNDVVKNRGTLDQTLMRIHIIDKSFSELKNSIDKVLSLIKVEDVEGNNMLMKQFDANLLNSYIKEK